MLARCRASQQPSDNTNYTTLDHLGKPHHTLPRSSNDCGDVPASPKHSQTSQPLGILRYLVAAKPRSKRCGARPSPASSANDASRRSSCHSAWSHRQSAAALGQSQSFENGHMDNLEPGSTPGSNRMRNSQMKLQ